MPFYEYECPSCKYYAEVLQKITDKALKKCPSCGKAGFRKLVSAPVFRLKGSGWYETDFKGDSDNKRNLAGAEREPPAAEAQKDAKADAKSDSKADAKIAADAKPAADSKAAAKPATEGKAGAEKRSSSAAKTKRGASRAAPRRPAARKSAGRGGKRR